MKITKKTIRTPEKISFPGTYLVFHQSSDPAFCGCELVDAEAPLDELSCSRGISDRSDTCSHALSEPFHDAMWFLWHFLPHRRETLLKLLNKSVWGDAAKSSDIKEVRQGTKTPRKVLITGVCQLYLLRESVQVVEKYVFSVFCYLYVRPLFGVKEWEQAHKDVSNGFITPFLTLVDTLIYKNKNRYFTCG